MTGAILRAGDNANAWGQCQDLRRRAPLELPQRLGLGREAAWQQRSRARVSSCGKLYKNVPVLDTRARGSVDHLRPAPHRRRRHLVGERSTPGRCANWAARESETIVPSISMLRNRRWPSSTRSCFVAAHAQSAQAYLEFLYTPEGQEIAARDFYRPRDATVAAKYASQFAQVDWSPWRQLRRVEGRAERENADGGGVFDQITSATAK